MLSRALVRALPMWRHPREGGGLSVWLGLMAVFVIVTLRTTVAWMDPGLRRDDGGGGGAVWAS